MTKEEVIRAWFNCKACNTEWILTLENGKRVGDYYSVGDYECLYCGEKQTYFIGWSEE